MDLTQKVSKMSLIEVLQEECLWPVEILHKDNYFDDITKNCMNDIGKLLRNNKRILIIGCAGGGYNTFQLCKTIIDSNHFVPKITVIDRKKQKIRIGI